MKRRILILIVSIALTILTGGPLLAGERKDVTLDVAGMTCRLCPRAVEKSLTRVNGVEEATVSYREKGARVTYDADETSIAELIKAVERAGYKARERNGE